MTTRRKQPPSSAGLWRENGLSILLIGLFVVCLIGNAVTGQRHENAERHSHGKEPISLREYVAGGAFLESVFENWESEFFQMGLFVILTVFLRQKGSSESKPLVEEPDQIDPGPAPGPVKKGGLALALYRHSLSLAFLALFLVSFAGHAVAGLAAYNEERHSHGLATAPLAEYVGSSQFWFESFQNWQSEFLAVGLIVILSIFLREDGSPQSKPVRAPHGQTGP
jgi:hypothetical protein